MPKSIRSRLICFWTESIQLYDDAQDHDNDDDDDGVDDDDEEDDDDTRPILPRFGAGTSQNLHFHVREAVSEMREIVSRIAP